MGLSSGRRDRKLPGDHRRENCAMGEDSKKAEIYCPVCGKETLVIRRPAFEGLKKVGEKLVCSACGTEFKEDEEIAFVEREEPKVFSEEDGLRLCSHCRHYVVNPFTQRCMLHRKEVEATDTCQDFSLRKEKRKEEKGKDSDALKKLLGEGEDSTPPEES